MAGKPNPLAVLRAKKAFKDFTGRWPDKAYSAKLDDKTLAGYRLGEMVGVAYEATRDGKTDQYFHRFKKQARPDLVVRSDGKQIYAIGGNYHVTDRGIEDMAGMFVVNPSKRSRKRRARASSPRRNAKGRFLKNPTAPRAARRRASTRVTVVARPNPSRRRRRYRARGFRRNPLRVGTGKGSFDIMSMFVPAVMVGAGAVAAEVAMGYLPIPENLKQGQLRYVTKAAVSVAVGWGIAKFFNKAAGEAIALGGVAISSHDAIKAQLAKAMPHLAFGGRPLGYWNAGQVMDRSQMPMGDYFPGPNMNMGQYVPRAAFRA